MAESRNVSTLSSRELGEELRQLRKRAGMSATTVAETMGLSLGWLSKLETGSRGVNAMDLGHLLGVYRTPREVRQRIAKVAAEVASNPSSVIRAHGGSPDATALLRSNLRLTKAVTAYDPLVIPWVVQTESYAQHVLGSRGAAANRTDRQTSVFGSETPTEITVYVPEAVTRYPVAPRQVMQEQFMRLTLMHGWPRMRLLAVPYQATLDPVLRNPVTLLELQEPQSPVVYEETETAVAFHDDPTSVSAAQSRFRRLATQAVSPEESVVLFARWAEGYASRK